MLAAFAPLQLSAQAQSTNRFGLVDEILDRSVAERAFAGGVVAVGWRGQLVHLSPFGHLSFEADAARVTHDTVYDLASLTKVIATTTMAMILVDEDRLDLDQKVHDLLPEFVGPQKERVTVRHLLAHASGVDWWTSLVEHVDDPTAAVERILQMDLVSEPGTETKYSDLGFLILGEILERLAECSLEEFARTRIFEPLAMTDTGFLPTADLVERIAPTEVDPGTGTPIRGVVHDENSRALGGIAAHAGLFGTAEDLARFARMMLDGGKRALVFPNTIELFTAKAGLVDGSDRALGWDTKSERHSSAGSLFSERSFGHTGFTGTSMWIDPERQLFVILLTNRVHPSRDNLRIREVRPAVADAVVRALGLEKDVRDQ